MCDVSHSQEPSSDDGSAAHGSSAPDLQSVQESAKYQVLKTRGGFLAELPKPRKVQGSLCK